MTVQLTLNHTIRVLLLLCCCFVVNAIASVHPRTNEELHQAYLNIFSNEEVTKNEKIILGQSFIFDIDETIHPEIAALAYLQLMHLSAGKRDREAFQQWNNKLSKISLPSENLTVTSFLAQLYQSELSHNEGKYALAISQGELLKNQLDNIPYLQNRNFSKGKLYLKALDKAVLFNILGISLFQTTNYEEAQKYFLQSKSIYENNHVTKGMFSVYNNLSLISWAQKNYKQAIMLMQKSLEITNATTDELNYLVGLTNLGIYYAADEQYDNAISSYNKVLQHSQINQYPKRQIHSLISKSEVFQKMGDLVSSEKFINEALSLSAKSNDTENLTSSRVALADLLVEKSDFAQALNYYQQAIDYYKSVKMVDYEVKILSKISELHKKRGDFQKALSFSEEFNQRSIELLKKAQQTSILNLSEKYQAEARDKQIQMLKQNNELNQAKYTKDLNQKTFIIFASCSIIVVLLLLFSKHFSRKQSNKLKQVNDEIKENEKQLLLLSHAFSNTSDAVWITNENFEIVAVNNAFVQHTHKTKHEVIGKKVSFSPVKGQDSNIAERIMIQAKLDDTWQGELYDVRSDDEIYPIELDVEVIRNEDTEIIHYLGVFKDITERKKSEEQLTKLATHDDITGLPNRTLLDQLIQQSCLNSKHTTKTPTLLLLNVNNFKKINDSLGHKQGNQLICDISKRLKATLFSKDVISRLNGAEFCILAELNEPKRSAARVAQKALSVFEQPFELQDTSLSIKASMGITLYPDDSENAEGLLRKAAIALIDVKKGENHHYRFFEQHMNIELLAQLEQEQKLLNAIVNQSFEYYYQPLVNIETGRISGAEALIRGIAADGSIISPEQFIPVAEKAGFIDQIDRITINKVFQQISIWQNERVQFGTISINLSGKMFSQATELLNLLQAKLSEFRINANTIKIEITESMVLDNINQAIETMEDIKGLGFQLALDDFGTGFSSLNYLKKFPIDILKIDRSFIMGMHECPTDRSIVQSIVSLAHTLNLKVVGEGVELEQHLAELQSLKCEEYQGYFYSKHLALNSFESLLLPELKQKSGSQ